MDLNLLEPLARAALLAGLLASPLAGAEVLPEPGYGLPRDASTEGWRIDWLLHWAHVLDLFLFGVMCAWMGIACVRHGRQHQAVYDHGDSKRSVAIVLALCAFTFSVVDGNLFVNTLVDLDAAFWNFKKPAEDPRTVRLEVNAHQWSWDVRHAGADGRFGTADDIVTWNEVRVPAGAPIYLQLTSTDVIHSFYLPNFRTKMDVVPGQVTRMWFEARPDTAGQQFEIACAQHCGTHHYKMRGVLTVMEEGAFRQWVKEASINAERAYDPEDAAANWAWEWKEL